MTTLFEPSDQAGALKSLRITGTDIHYYVVCIRKVWWRSHGLEQENQEGNDAQEAVALGKQVHESSYQSKATREVMIDDLLRLDFTEGGVIHEVKKSKSMEKASEIQLLYYLYYLKRVKGVETTGELDYPLLRRTKEISLTQDSEGAVEDAIAGIVQIRTMDSPPYIEKPTPICRKCSYQDLCWG